MSYGKFLDFFKEQFGGSLKLLKIIDLYNMLHGKKQIKKEKTTLPTEVLSQYCISETEKMFKFDDEHMDAMLADLCNHIPDQDIPLLTKIQTEQETKVSSLFSCSASFIKQKYKQ